MRTCSAFNCKERSTISSKLTFHKFPADPKRRMMWIRAVCRKDPITGDIWEPSRHNTLCSKHFTDDMFDRTRPMRVRLREDAVPSIFDGIPKHLQIKVIRKKITQDDPQSPAPVVDYLSKKEPSQEVFNNILSSDPRHAEMLPKCQSKSKVSIASGSDKSSPSNGLAKCHIKNALKHPEATIANAIVYTLEEYKDILSTEVQDPRHPEMLTKCQSKSKVSIASGSDKSSPSNGLAKCQPKNVLKHPEATISNAVVYTIEEYKDILSTEVQSLEEEESMVDGNWSDSSSSSRSPTKEELKRKICCLELKLLNSAKKIKRLEQSNRRWQQKVEKLKSIVKIRQKESFNCENSSVNILKLKNCTPI